MPGKRQVCLVAVAFYFNQSSLYREVSNNSIALVYIYKDGIIIERFFFLNRTVILEKYFQM